MTDDEKTKLINQTARTVLHLILMLAVSFLLGGLLAAWGMYKACP